jgi:hypothetical protein
MHSIIYTKINTHFLYLAEFFLEWWNVSNVQKMKTNFMFKNLFFEKRAVYEIIWKYIVQPGRPKITTWRRRIACWISKTKNINTVHSVLFCIFCFALYILLCSVYFVLFCTFCFVLYLYILFSSCQLALSGNPDWFYSAFSSVVRQMPGYTSQRRGTVRSLHN